MLHPFLLDIFTAAGLVPPPSASPGVIRGVLPLPTSTNTQTRAGANAGAGTRAHAGKTDGARAGGGTTPGTQAYFAKTGSLPQVRGEAASLVAMASTAPPGLVPDVIGYREDGGTAGLVTTYAERGGRREMRALGAAVAGMHRVPEREGDTAGDVGVRPTARTEGMDMGTARTDTDTSAVPRTGTTDTGTTNTTSTSTRSTTNTHTTENPHTSRLATYTGRYGFPVPTHCGATEQDNTWEDSWEVFFRDRRLGEVVRRLGDARVRERWERMKGRTIPLLLRDFHPPPVPVPLHGDLWAGNVAHSPGGPVIFDPAGYYGHGEADLGIVQMFGGFTSEFYDAYHAIHPRSKPYHEQRIRLYELYHHLNHAVLFGWGYTESAVGIMDELLAWTERVG